MAAADPKKKKKKRKKKESLEHKRNRILVALGIFAVVYALDELGALAIAFGEPGNIYASFVLFLVPFLIAGYDVLQKAFNNIRRGKAFDESFLMAVATIGALHGALPRHRPAHGRRRRCHAVLPGRRVVPGIRRGQEPQVDQCHDGHRARLR